MEEEIVRQIIRDELSNILKIDRYVFDKNIRILDARNIQFGRTNGTKIGTATDQKIGFYGTTPAIQGVTISDPSGGATVDTEARTAIVALIDRLQTPGIIA